MQIRPARRGRPPMLAAATFAKCSPKDAVCAQVKAKLAAPLSFVLRLPLLIVAGEEEEEPLLTYFWSCRRRGKLWGGKRTANTAAATPPWGETQSS